MTLPEYFTLQEAVLNAMGRLKSDIWTADQEEVLELANRLRKAVDTLSRAECGSASNTNFQESARIIRESRRVLFALQQSGRFSISCNEYSGVNTLAHILDAGEQTVKPESKSTLWCGVYALVGVVCFIVANILPQISTGKVELVDQLVIACVVVGAGAFAMLVWRLLRGKPKPKEVEPWFDDW